MGRPSGWHLRPAGRQRNGADARLRDRDVVDQPTQRTDVATVRGICRCRRLRLGYLSDPYPGSVAQRRGRADHRCDVGQGISEGFHCGPESGGDGDRHQLVGVHQHRPGSRWRGLGKRGRDRLNSIQTAFWAFAQKPIEGWGIARFQVVNTYHHQQWSADIPWIGGYGIVSHENELGILAELGVIGLRCVDLCSGADRIPAVGRLPDAP